MVPLDDVVVVTGVVVVEELSVSVVAGGVDVVVVVLVAGAPVPGTTPGDTLQHRTFNNINIA